MGATVTGLPHSFAARICRNIAAYRRLAVPNGLEGEIQFVTQPLNTGRSASAVVQQSLEPIVHMVLDMAMEQRRPWLVRGEVHTHPAI